MATFFRAAIMLTVLVGLPSAWVYYGPLPPQAMGVIERTVMSAKYSIGWSGELEAAAWDRDLSKTAPRFDPTTVDAIERQRQPSVAAELRQDPQFSLATATIAVPPAQATLNVDPAMARRLEPHLSLLRSLNVAEYTLENWGESGQLFRFRCAVTLGSSDDHTRQFDAIDVDPLRAVQQVVGNVTAWQNARHTNTTTTWR
ncbi:MAG: hypothetical protein AAGD11_05170 [Planctomycetota bacterium]